MNDKYNWKIIINDSLCTYEYEIEEGRGDVSILDVAEFVHKFLGSKQPLRDGKYVEGSGDYTE